MQYENVQLLMELRHALLYFKPTWDEDRPEIVALKHKLSRRFIPSPFYDSSEDFVTFTCMGVGCTRWSVTSVFAFVRAFTALTDLYPDKINGFLWLDDGLRAG